ncbi:LysR family transcriptional regulator [Thalassospira sp.]|uniref:LysR family transcriptional regulator n=1 Tax=Thalassospira sp. TaxID=1912094 RepID=UPI003AA9DD2A
MHTPDWEGLKTFVVLCRAGNMSAAARELGINQTTVSRRIARLEDMLGYTVLQRGNGSMAPTQKAASLLAMAQEMEANVAGFMGMEPDTQPALAELAGTVRVTSVDALLEGVLVPAFADFCHRHPGVQLDLSGGNRNLNVARRETDLTLRLARPESGAFRARRVGTLKFGIYGTRADMNPATANWIDLVDGFADKPEQQWLNRHFAGRRIVGRANRSAMMGQMAVQAECCCLLPGCVGDQVSGLHRLNTYQVTAYREVWLLVHQDMAHLAHVRAVMNWIIGLMRQ